MRSSSVRAAGARGFPGPSHGCSETGPASNLRSLPEGIMRLLLCDRRRRAMAREQGEIVGKRQELLSNALQMGRIEGRGVRAPNAAGEQGVADEDALRRPVAHAAGGVTGRRQKPQAELAEVDAPTLLHKSA